MEFLKENWNKLLSVVFILVGLAAAIYLVKNPQIFKTHASVEVSGVSVSDTTDQEPSKTQDNGKTIFTVKTPTVHLHYDPSKDQ